MLSDVVADVVALFTLEGTPALVYTGKDIPAREPDPGAAVPIGRVVFVPTQDTFPPSENIGSNPRSLITRYAGADVHIWAVGIIVGNQTQEEADLAAVEALVHQTIRAMHLSANTSYEVGRGAWTNDAKTVAYGAEYVMQVAIKVPVLDAPWPVVPGSITPLLDGQMVFPAGTESVC